MLGFVADYASGDIHIAVDELADAQWFAAEQLNQLELPQPGTLSRKLIEYWRNRPNA
jgi:NAD+ diphosphatase